MEQNTIGIVDDGQLGMMLAEAAIRLGLKPSILGHTHGCAGAVAPYTHIELPYSDEDTLREFARTNRFITWAWENIPKNAIRFLLGHRKGGVWPSIVSLKVGSDRIQEKRMFQKLDLAVPPYARVDRWEDLAAAMLVIGLPLMLKACSGGYDGKNQRIINFHNRGDLQEIYRELSRSGTVPLIAERKVDFQREVSMVCTRWCLGDIVYSPLIRNVHRGGILRYSEALANDPLEQLAQAYCKKILTYLGHIGTLAVEFFDLGGVLYGNEIAPRVHNSGHLSDFGAVASQFENHVRAVTGMAPQSAAVKGYAGMLNIIEKHPVNLHDLPGVHVKIYGKEEREGRKLGHVTIVAESAARYRELVHMVANRLPGFDLNDIAV